MSSREPLWFCHQCHAEMRPLMTPNPICASCRGSFVEKLENPADDPRDFQNRAPDVFDVPNNIPGAFEGFLRSVTEDSPTNHRPRSPPTQRTHDNASANSGLRFEFHTGPSGANTRTFILGGSNTLRRSPTPTDHVPTMLEFLRREPEATPNFDINNSNIRGPNGDITGTLMAQYLLALFGREHRGMVDPFAELLGIPASARWGDYVFNQEALDQILTQLAENSTAGRPIPATEEIVGNLPREVLTEGSPLLERDCAVCKESFKLHPEDPDELIVVTLPCKHPFHEGCILPWLKSSGTCPVCRFALVAQPQQHPPGGPSQAGGSSSSNRPNPSSGSRQHSSGNSDRGGPAGFFHTLFGGGPSGNSGNGNTIPARSRRNFGRGNRNTHPETLSHNTPPFPGEWIEDID